MSAFEAINNRKPGVAIKAATSLAAKRPSRMTLDNIVRGRVAKPIRVVMHGLAGIGKSTFASEAPRPIFLGAEDGTSELDVARLLPETWEEMFEAIDMLSTETHEFKTLVIDTADWAEHLCWQHVAKSARKQSIEDFGYGKGFTVAFEEFRRLVAALDRLREKRGMNVIVLAHTWIKSFKNPEGEDFDRYEMKLHKLSSGLLGEWADCVLFANYETLTKEVDKRRSKGISTGARYIYTERNAAWDAKNRYSLPPVLPLKWDDFAQAVADGRPASPQSLRDQIAALLERADPELAQLVKATVEKAGDDAALLAKIASRVEARVNLQQQEEGKE